MHYRIPVQSISHQITITANSVSTDLLLEFLCIPTKYGISCMPEASVHVVYNMV